MAELSVNKLPPRTSVFCELTELELPAKEVEKRALCGPTAQNEMRGS